MNTKQIEFECYKRLFLIGKELNFERNENKGRKNDKKIEEVERQI
jgi:hypothetical protein